MKELCTDSKVFALSFVPYSSTNDSNESLNLKRDGFVGVCDSSSKKKEEEKTFLEEKYIKNERLLRSTDKYSSNDFSSVFRDFIEKHSLAYFFFFSLEQKII